MFQYMEELSQTEAVNIKKTIQDLFRQTCILQVKCDPVTMIQRDNPRYRVCERNKEFISDYLSVLDCELVHDPQEHIFRITGAGLPTEKMNLTTTRILLLLKIIYREKIMGEGLNATVTNVRKIRESGRNTNLLTRKLTQQEWQEALTMLKTHQIIELPGAVGNLEDDTPIYIYSTINIFCSSVDINELVKRYEEEMEQAAETEQMEIVSRINGIETADKMSTLGKAVLRNHTGEMGIKDKTEKNSAEKMDGAEKQSQMEKTDETEKKESAEKADETEKTESDGKDE